MGWLVGVIDLLLLPCLTMCEVVSAWLCYFCLQGTGPAEQAGRVGAGGPTCNSVFLCRDISELHQHSAQPLNTNTLPGRRSSTWTTSSWMFLCSERERWCWCLCNVWCGVVWCGPPALSGGESGGVGWSRHLPAAATVTPVDSTDCHPVTPSSVRNNFSTSYLLSKQHHQTWPDLSPPPLHCNTLFTSSQAELSLPPSSSSSRASQHARKRFFLSNIFKGKPGCALTSVLQ